MRHRAILAIPFLLLTVATAQGVPPDPQYVGDYRFAGSDEDGRRRVQQALAPALARINPLMRGMAEQRLRERLAVARRIVIGLDGERISVRFVGEQDRTFTSRAGHPRDVEARDGRQARMTQLFRDGHLEQIFEGENGRMYNVFELDASSERLTLTIILTSERLESPVRVSLPYVRTGE